MKTIFFVRHGESESNVANIISGSGDDVPLTATGRTQASRAATDLKDKNIDLIVCSPLIRTIQTATIIAAGIGYDPAKIVTNPILTERRYGIYDGKPDKIYLQDLQAARVHASVETPKEMYERFAKAIDWLRSLDADCILVVSHGAASRAIRALDQKLHHSHMYKLDAFKNCEIYKFTI